MLNRKTKRLNTTGLFAQNAKTIFKTGYVGPLDVPPPIVWLFHTLFLPISLTVGAGVKTGVDAMSRKELSTEDLQIVKIQLATLSDEQLDQVVADVIKYNPKSELSRSLKTTLQDINAAADQELAKLKKSVFDQFASEKQQEFFTAISEKFGAANKMQASQLIIKETDFTAEESKQMQDKIAAESIGIVANKRKQQLEAIQGYLDNNINAGTKMEQVIEQSVRNMPK